MPRKDGSPTAAERKDAARIEGNNVFIANATTGMLRSVRSNMVDHDQWAAAIDAEIARRGE